MEKVIILAVTLVLGCILLWREGLMPKKGVGRVLVFLLLLAAMGARCALMDKTPSAEEDALREAISWFRNAGGFYGVRNYRGPFSVGAQYILSAAAAAKRGSVYIFKCIEFIFALLLAWSAQRCVASVSGKSRPRLWVFLLALLLPSGILESSGGMGQSVYALLPVLAAAVILSGRFGLGGALLGAAVAVYPGVLWVLPVFWVFPAVRENTWKTLLAMAGGYFLLLLPALLLGRDGSLIFPFWPGLSHYFALEAQRGAPGLYACFPALTRAAGIAAYLIFVGLTIFRLSGQDAVRDRRRQLSALAFSALAAGGLLPGVSPGALIGGEAVCLALCALEPGMIPAAVLASGAGGLGLAMLFFPELIPFSLPWAAGALFLAMALLLGNVLFRR